MYWTLFKVWDNSHKTCHNTGIYSFFRCKKTQLFDGKKILDKNTIFNGAKFFMRDLVALLYAFSCRRSVWDSSETSNLFKKTVMSFYKFFRSKLCCILDAYSCEIGVQVFLFILTKLWSLQVRLTLVDICHQILYGWLVLFI